MAAGSYDMTCEQGTTFIRTLTVKNPDGSLRDFTDFTGRMHVRRRITDITPIIELTSENGRLSLNSDGQIVVSLSASETAAMTDGGVYDLEIENSTGDVERVIEGQFNFKFEVTR